MARKLFPLLLLFVLAIPPQASPAQAVPAAGLGELGQPNGMDHRHELGERRGVPVKVSVGSIIGVGLSTRNPGESLRSDQFDRCWSLRSRGRDGRRHDRVEV